MNIIPDSFLKPLSSISNALARTQVASSFLWRGLQARYIACYSGAKVQLPFIHDIVLNLHHIFSLTPEEYAQRAHLQQKNWNTVMKPIRTDEGTIYEPYIDMPPVAAGRVRVKFYPNMMSLYRDSVLSIDVPLSPSGGLDLKIVQREWGLQNCRAIDSTRLEVFQSALKDPNMLSPMSVRLLTEGHYWLRVIEQPTAGRLAVRNMRRAIQQVGRSVTRRACCTWERSHPKWLEGYLSVSLFIGGCFATTYYMDLFSMQYEFYLDDACNTVWEILCEYVSVALHN
ncbi:hypothetical protein BDY19DRAFT_905039 [Irpex rosettiformis]|uniref:Uncharacterized protein n=1 Tax=Irpex rosettiformis TaxID=378272 RepID=A0ACB8U9E9_9APHY|nr:hypothetical protein BDY19DRAFT_905039 [Irpex rosettiformis]